RFLENENGVPDDNQWYRDGDLFDYDVRTGIRIDAETLTAARSQIYGVRMLALRPEVSIKGANNLRARVVLYEEMILPPGAPSTDSIGGPIPLGGEGRHAALTVVPAVSWPESRTTDGDWALWLLATPGIFGGRDGNRRADRPDGIVPPARLVAAASGGPLAVSGWDIAMNGPRPTRFAVPAGAVYCVEGSFEPDGGSLCRDGELVQEGWGFALRGVWNDG
ncbi:MAG: type III-B CRISPR module-associated Cmr3 family protein, partial [Isosphaeraceae bacterium]